MATDETDRLISSDKAVGTAVYNRQAEHIGSVYNLMIDKYSGQVAYAVMSFGGFLGIGESYHPLPWKKLTYDPRLGGYVVDLDRRGARDSSELYLEHDARLDRPCLRGSASTSFTECPRYGL